MGCCLGVFHLRSMQVSSRVVPVWSDGCRVGPECQLWCQSYTAPGARARHVLACALDNAITFETPSTQHLGRRDLQRGVSHPIPAAPSSR